MTSVISIFCVDIDMVLRSGSSGGSRGSTDPLARVGN